MAKIELRKKGMVGIDFSEESAWQGHFPPLNRNNLPYKAEESNQNRAFIYLSDKFWL